MASTTTIEEDEEAGNEADKGVFTNITKMGPGYNQNRMHAAGSTTNPDQQDGSSVGEGPFEEEYDEETRLQVDRAWYSISSGSAGMNFNDPNGPLANVWNACSHEEKQNWLDKKQKSDEAHAAVAASVGQSPSGTADAGKVMTAMNADFNVAETANNATLVHGTTPQKQAASQSNQDIAKLREIMSPVQAKHAQMMKDGLAEGKTQEQINIEFWKWCKENKPETYAKMKEYSAGAQANPAPVAAAPNQGVTAGTGTTTSLVAGGVADAVMYKPSSGKMAMADAIISQDVATQLIASETAPAKQVTPVADFNNASLVNAAPVIAIGPIIGQRSAGTAADVVAKDVANYVSANSDLLYASEKDNLDDYSNALNNTLWDAFDNNRVLVNNYDAAVAKVDSTSAKALESQTPESFLAYHQAVLDRKIAVNDIAQYGAGKDPQALMDAKAERANLDEGKARLTELQATLAGKTDEQKAEIMKAAFPPDAPKGQTVGLYDSYVANKNLEKPSTDPKIADANGYEDDYSYLDYYGYDDWMDSEWYDDGTSCVATPAPTSAAQQYNAASGITSTTGLPPVNDQFALAANGAAPDATADPALKPVTPGITTKNDAVALK